MTIASFLLSLLYSSKACLPLSPQSSKLFEVVWLMGTEALDRGRWSVSEQEAIKMSL